MYEVKSEHLSVVSEISKVMHLKGEKTATNAPKYFHSFKNAPKK